MVCKCRLILLLEYCETGFFFLFFWPLYFSVNIYKAANAEHLYQPQKKIRL